MESEYKIRIDVSSDAREQVISPMSVELLWCDKDGVSKMQTLCRESQYIDTVILHIKPGSDIQIRASRVKLLDIEIFDHESHQITLHPDSDQSWVIDSKYDSLEKTSFIIRREQ